MSLLKTVNSKGIFANCNIALLREKKKPQSPQVKTIFLCVSDPWSFFTRIRSQPVSQPCLKCFNLKNLDPEGHQTSKLILPPTPEHFFVNHMFPLRLK